MTLNLASYLAQGYGADEILKFVEKSFPNIGKAISAKKSSGIDAKDILKLIASLDAKQLKKADDNASRMNFDNPLERANAGAKSQQANPLLQAAKVGGTALAGAAAIGAAPLLGRGASQVAANSLPTTPNIPKTPYESTIAPSMKEGMPSPNFQPGPTLKPQDMQSVQTQMQPKGQPQPQPNISPSSIQSPVPSQPPNVNSSQILQEMGLTEKINNLFKAGNNPEQISAGVQLSLTPGSKNYLQNKLKSGEAKPLPEMIQDYLTEQQGQQRTEAAQKIDQVTPEQKTAISEKLMAGEKAKPLEKMVEQTPQKGSVVSTPDGMVGEIKDIKKKEALVESDGKLHKVKVDELIQSPLPEKDMADLYDDLIKGIEKETGEEVSRNVNWAGYDPEKNQLAYLPRDGALYIYDDISEQDKSMLEKFMSTRKTTGENYIGAWTEGTKSPIGAGMSALIKKLQAERGGKGNEYSQKFPTLYSALEPAQKAAKAKKRKKK